MQSDILDRKEELQELRLKRVQVEEEGSKARQACPVACEQSAEERDHAMLAMSMEQYLAVYQAALRQFHDADASLTAACKASESTAVPAEQRQAIVERSQCLAKMTEQLAMLENASGAPHKLYHFAEHVLRRHVLEWENVGRPISHERADSLDEDIQHSTALVARMADEVYQRAAAAFRTSMSEAIPQLDFDLQLQGDRVADGVKVMFREHKRGIRDSDRVGSGGELLLGLPAKHRGIPECYHGCVKACAQKAWPVPLHQGQRGRD